MQNDDEHTDSIIPNPGAASGTERRINTREPASHVKCMHGKAINRPCYECDPASKPKGPPKKEVKLQVEGMGTEEFLVKTAELTAKFTKESNIDNEVGKKEFAEQLAMQVMLRRLLFHTIARGEAKNITIRSFHSCTNICRKLTEQLGLADVLEEGIGPDEF